MTFVPEPYQTEGATYLSKRRRAMFVSPAGSGKTDTLAMAIDMVLRAKHRDRKVFVGWLANTIEQCGQAWEAMEKFPSIAALCEVRVACAAADIDWTSCDVLIVDEQQHATAPQWFKQIAACKGALWGMTATPTTGHADRDALLLEMFGHNVYTVRRSEVSNRILPARVVMLDACDHDIGERIDREIVRLEKDWGRKAKFARIHAERLGHTFDAVAAADWEIKMRVQWNALVEIGIVGNKARNAAAMAMAKKHVDQHVLVLANRVDHVKSLALDIGNHATACYADMGKTKRAQAMNDFRTDTKKCLVASSLADEGLNLPMAEVLVMVSAGRSNVKVEQRVGRICRRHMGKTEAVCYDFLDQRHPLMAKHAQKRMALYRKLGYTIELPGASKELELAL